MLADHQRQKRERAPAAPQETPHSDRDQQHEKKAKQVPAGQPGPVKVVDAGGRQHAVAGPQVQHGAQRLHILRPANGG